MFLTPLLIHRKLPVTARTAGSCDWPKEPSAPLAFILLYFRPAGSPPIQGENYASMTVIDFRHTAPTRAASSLWRATDTSLSLFADTAPHTAKQGRFFLASGGRCSLCQRHRNSGIGRMRISSLCPSAFGPSKVGVGVSPQKAFGCQWQAKRSPCPAERQEISVRILCRQHT